MTMLLSLVYFLIFHFIPITHQAVCFFPDGLTTDRLAIPCNQTAGAFSACCRPTQEDICQPQGHCYSTTAGYWRNGCTDSTWQTPNCAKICLSDTPGGNSSWEVQMTACNTDGSFCCGKMDPRLCCASANRMFLPTNVTRSSMSPSLPNSDASSSSAAGSAPIAAASHPPESLNKQARIGIGVGASVFVVATAILLIFMILAKRRRKERGHAVGSTLSETAEIKRAEAKGTAVYEKDGSERYEVDQYGSHPPLRDDPRSAVELPGKMVFPSEEDRISK